MAAIGPCTILVVDDEPSILRMITRVLEDVGCRILTAGDAGDALRAIDGDSPDLVVADIRLPGMDGIELTRRIKRHSPDTRVLLISAYGEPLDHPGDGFVGKPFDNDELLAHVLNLIQGRLALSTPFTVLFGGTWPLDLRC